MALISYRSPYPKNDEKSYPLTEGPGYEEITSNHP